MTAVGIPQSESRPAALRARSRTPQRRESNSTMNVFVIIALGCLGALAWLWYKKPGLKRAPAHTWPASRCKTGARHRFATLL